MPDTQSVSSQGESEMLAKWCDQTAPIRVSGCEGTGADPASVNLAAVAVLTLTTLAIPAPSSPHMLRSAAMTTSTQSASQAQVAVVDAKAELKARYKRMPKTAWFKAAHENRSLGEPLKTS